MKDYYHILRLARTASDEEIKKSFRRLAVKYHPDRNPGIAPELFQEINEAYDTLGDKEKKLLYDQRYEYYFVKKGKDDKPVSPPSSSYPNSRPRYAAPAKFDYSIYSSYFKWINRIGLALCLFLLIDYSFSKKYYNERILWMDDPISTMPHYKKYRTAHGFDYLINVRTNSKNFDISVNNALKIDIHDSVDIYESRFLKIIHWVNFKNSNLAFPPHYGIYSSFLIIPSMMLIFSILGLTTKRRKWIVDFGIGTLAFMVFTIVFIYASY